MASETTPNESAGGKPPADPAFRAPPLCDIRIWPHRSLNRDGYLLFMRLMAVGLTTPIVLLAASLWMRVEGMAIALGIIGVFAMLALFGLRWALRANQAAGAVWERVRIWPHLALIERGGPRARAPGQWRMQPFWTQVDLIDQPNAPPALILRSGAQRVQIADFLNEEERRALADALRAALIQAVT